MRTILTVTRASSHPHGGVAGSAPLAAQHLQSWTTVPSSVVSGILVAVILAAARVVWHRTRVPSALSRRVRRRSYLGAVRAESKRPEVRRLDVYAPRLLPARDNEAIARIQAA
jgi:hypothetical protein